MQHALRRIHLKFTGLLLLLVAIITLLMWGVLQIVNVTTIGSPSDISEVHNSTKNSEELVSYIESQKDFEAHFVTLATDIKAQEQRTLTIVLLVTAGGMLLLALPVTFLVSKHLMKPVEDAYASQERFLQDAAHELRNPLAALTIALQQYKDPNEVPASLLTTFRRQTKRLVQINEDLLFLERRTQTGESLQRINISELLQDVVEDVSISSRRKQIKLDVKTDEDIHKVMAPADYVRITKNVLDNAIKYSPKSSKVKVRQTILKNGFEIVISDQGIGIPESEVDRIGERFFRASNVGSIDGTGLGHAIIGKLLNLYGGSIRIESTINKGTAVRIFLPT